MDPIQNPFSPGEHKRLKALAALRGKSIKDYVLERTLGSDAADEAALRELEAILDSRIHEVQSRTGSRRTVTAVFAEAARELAK